MADKGHKPGRALLIGRRVADPELQNVLSGYGYRVEHCETRDDGIRAFRGQKQALVIVDAEAINGFPERFFRFFGMVRDNAIVLVAAGPQVNEASRYLLWGAHDILPFPLKPEALNFTLTRASAHHRSLVRATFVRYMAWFSAVMLPLWAAVLYLSVYH